MRPLCWSYASILLLAVAGLLLGCSRRLADAPALRETAGPAWFAEVTADVGLDFVHDPGPTGHFFMPQIIGAGAALFYDGQGRRDYCHPQQFAGAVTKLYRNLGRQKSGAGRAIPPVRFEDATEKAGLGRLTGPGLGVVCADFNGDGWPDIFVANDG